ncbi:hypothetical protein [Pseudoalteromonas luteoviolacea]|uniref:hypothetical protein n=1 Tax=Pseudoalteromonas luteoviolacea TaxID=43657 RepID=UPI00163CAFF1|nr:hypothetical protein [Pseudoalteromonas luteoviolacea]
MSDHIEVTISGTAQVQIKKTVTLPKAQAEAMLASDEAMQNMLVRHESFSVSNWENIYSHGKREFSIESPAPGFVCANHLCRWVGNESDKKVPEDSNGSEAVCPKCKGNRFYKVQQVVPRG